MAENKEIPWEKELIEKYMFTLHKETGEKTTLADHVACASRIWFCASHDRLHHFGI
ncbi:hypothetical protein [Vibrio cholerae]|uniref:hypothetical protein n=1 Tax=Vibrio cholerae TaxID=666 RepID=UPI003C6EE642